MPWKEMSVMDQKKEFILLWKSNRYTLTELSNMFEVSRPTLYKYLRRYQDYGMKGLEELSRVPKTIANKTPDVIEQEIVRLRNRHPRWGAGKLLVLLEDVYPECELPKIATVNNILKRQGLVKERKRRRKIEPKHPIFDPKKPNEVWSADFKGKFRMGNREYCYPLTLADSCSRYVFAAKGLHGMTIKETKPICIDVFRRYGLPQQIHTDNGSPFGSISALGRYSQLAVWFMDLGIQPVYSDPVSYTHLTLPTN